MWELQSSFQKLFPPVFSRLAVLALMTGALTLVAAASLPGVATALEPGAPVPVAPGVPDQGRAWELVTPPDPNSSSLYAIVAVGDDGNAIAYLSIGMLPPSASTGYPGQVNLALRESNGWRGTSIGPPYPAAMRESTVYPMYLPEALTPDLTGSIWGSPFPRPPGQPGDFGLFRRNPNGAFDLLANYSTSAATGPNLALSGEFSGASADLRRVVFTATKHLLPGDVGRSEGESVYESAAGELRLVDVNSSGSLLSTCGSTVPPRNAISRDGNRIYFVTRPGCAGPARVFLREGETTTEVSASQCDLADCGPETDATFVAATPSGSAAFLLTEQRLSDDDADSAPDLYRYDVADDRLTLVSVGTETPEVDIWSKRVRVSADGSRVYFAGAERFFVVDAGGTHVLPVRSVDFLQTSADGRVAVFSTTEQLVAADSDQAADVYRYDVDSGSMALLSTGSVGGNAPIAAEIAPTVFNEPATDEFAALTHLHPYRAMSDDGRRVFFATAERLIPEDRNDVTDVYEWAGGRLGLVSPGSGESPTLFFGASADGGTVFLKTTATLVPADRDGGDFDFYAARIGGGFPEGEDRPGCEGAACQPAGGATRRPTPESVTGSASAIRLGRPPRDDRQRAAATGWIEVLAEVPRSGRLIAVAKAKLGRKLKKVASSQLEVDPGATRVRMRLSSGARQRLDAGHDLRVRLTLSLAGLSRGIVFELGGKR